MKVSNVTLGQLKGFTRLLAWLLIFKVTCGVVVNNLQYFPPDFDSEFLAGRRHYFYGPYQYAFYSHVVSGPVSLFLGLMLISKTFRRRWPIGHRWIGRLQVLLIVLVVAPGGFGMALKADGGWPAGTGFAVLAILTAATAAMGYLTARRRNIAAHQRWMLRCFLLLTSAVVLRLIAGVSIIAEIENEWVYPISAWVSWLIPVAVYEIVRPGGTEKKHAKIDTTIPP